MADIKFKLEADTVNFSAGINDAINEILKLAQESNAAQADIKKAFSDLGKMSFEVGGEKAVEYFRQQVEQSTQQVAQLSTQLEAMQEADGFDATSEEAMELTQALQEATEQAANFNAALEGAEKASQDSLGNVSKNTKDLGNALSTLPGPMNGAVGGFKKLVSAAKAFIATPIGAVIALMTGALSLLKSYLTGTAEGQVKAAKASAVFKSVLDSIKDVAIKLGKAISEAFENPKQAINNLADSIKKNLMTRVDGFTQQFKALGKIIQSVFKADWDGLKEGAKEYGDAASKMITGKGVDEWVDGFNKAKEAMSEFAEKTAKTAEEMGRLKERELTLRQQRSKWQIKEAAMDEQIAKERMKAYDEEATPAERAEALAKTQDLITKKYEKQIAFAQEEYDITKKRNSLHESTLEDIEAENDLQANIVRLQAQMASELASVERRRATAAKQAKEEEFKRGREALSLEVQIGETRLEMQDESLKKQLDAIELAKQRKQIELEAQKHEWEVSQHGKLTPEQEAYIENMSALIEEAADAEANKVIFDKYADEAAKAFKEQRMFDKDANLLEAKGLSTTEVRRQQNNAALAYMQSEEQEINPHFEMWVESLMKLTSNQLENMLANAEEELATLANSPDADPKKVIEARARVAALRKELKAANKDINRGADVKKYENLNKVLGDAAKGFEALGQTGNEAFDSIMKDVSEVLTSVQSVVGNIQTLVQSSIEAEKVAAQEGAEAVKTVEKASVILAIIGAVLQIATKIKSLLGNEKGKKEEEEYRAMVKDLKAAFADLKREMLLEDDSNTIFGDNAYNKLVRFTNAVDELTESMVESGRKALTAITGEDSILASSQNGRGRGGSRGMGNLAEIIESNQEAAKELDSQATGIAQALENYKYRVEKGTKWSFSELGNGSFGFYKQEKKAAKEWIEDLNLVGATAEETYKNIKAYTESDVFKNEYDDTVKRATEEWLKDYEAMLKAEQELKNLFSNFFGEMSDAFADSIKTGFEEGAAAGKASFAKSVNEMVSDFYMQMRIGERLADMQEDYGEKMVKARSTEEQQNIVLEYADTLADMYDEELAAYENLQARLEERGYGLKDAMDGTLSGAIKGASQESIDLLSGYCNAVRIQQVDGINIMRDQLISLSGIQQNTSNTNLILTAFKNSYERSLNADSVRATGAVA